MEDQLSSPTHATDEQIPNGSVITSSISQLPSPRNINKLQIGVVGIGRVGQRHALNLLRLTPRAHLVCACSPAEADLKWADEHLIPYGVAVFRELEDMLAFPGLQAVVIASATPLHYDHTMECIKRGIHVLCEKPIAASVEKLKDLVSKAEASPHLKVMVGFTRRFDENYREALERIHAGAIGEPVVIRSQGCEKLDDSDFMHQYLANSGGIFYDSVIHDIDLALSFFGDESMPQSVCAFGTAAHFKALQKDGDGDNAVGICQFRSGQIAYFYNSRTAAAGYDNQTEIFGTKGKISVNLVARRNRVEISDDNGVHVSALPSWADRYEVGFVTEVNAFVNGVLDGKPMPIPLRAAVTSLQIALGLQQSMRTGRKIDFDVNGDQIDG